MSKDFASDGSGLPSYSESILSDRPPSLPQSIAQTRTSLISALIATHITPHLYGSSLAGLSSTTLILVPTNVSSLQPESNISKTSDGKFKGESIEGFFSTENLSIIRLQGQENSVEFWRQPAVIRELEQQLRKKLHQDGHCVVGDASKNATFEGSKSPSYGFKKKDSGAEWKMPKIEKLGEGEVRAVAEVKDVCLRIENDMGLYETKKGKAIVVKVEVGE